MLCRACSKVTAGVPDGRRPRRRGSLSVTVRSGTLRDDPMAAGRIRRAHGPGRHGPRVRRITERLIPMCRNIKRLRHADHPPTDGELHDADYQPAVEEGMRRQLAEVAGIASDTAVPSFDNTIVALEHSGVLLTRAFKVFIAMTQANTDDTLQRVQTEEAPRLAAHLDAIHLNDTLFRRIRSVYERRADLGLDSVQAFLVERYYRDFVRAGALLAEPDKAALRALNQEESKLATDFQNRLLAATKAGPIIGANKNGLDALTAAGT